MVTRAYFAGLLTAGLLLAIGSRTPVPLAIADTVATTPTTAATPAPARRRSEPTLDERLAACRTGLDTLLTATPLEFRAGDDDLKASVSRLIAATAELSMRCPSAQVVVGYRVNHRLSEARARRLAERLTSLGVAVRRQPHEKHEHTLTFARSAPLAAAHD